MQDTGRRSSQYHSRPDREAIHSAQGRHAGEHRGEARWGPLASGHDAEGLKQSRALIALPEADGWRLLAEVSMKELLALNHGIDPAKVEEKQTILLPAGKLSSRDKEILSGAPPACCSPRKLPPPWRQP